MALQIFYIPRSIWGAGSEVNIRQTHYGLRPHTYGQQPPQQWDMPFVQSLYIYIFIFMYTDTGYKIQWEGLMGVQQGDKSGSNSWAWAQSLEAQGSGGEQSSPLHTPTLVQRKRQLHKAGWYQKGTLPFIKLLNAPKTSKMAGRLFPHLPARPWAHRSSFGPKLRSKAGFPTHMSALPSRAL